MLEDPEYSEVVQFKFEEWLKDFKDVQDKRLLWDLLKYMTRQLFMSYASKRKKKQKCEEREFEKTLVNAEELLITCENEELRHQAEELKIQLKRIEDHNTSVAIIR